jgi:hypothetical protein
VSLLITPVLFAQSTRVFVASTGMDTSTCPRTAPCRTFAYAMTQVAAGGEVVALDTAGYGTVTIPFSVSVYGAPGVVASVTASGGNGIAISAGASDIVSLRNLFVNANGQLGINFNTGHLLILEDSTVANGGDTGYGLGAWSSSPNPSVVVNNCRFVNDSIAINSGEASATNMLLLTVKGSLFASGRSNGEGVWIGSGVRGTVTDSTFIQNDSGITAVPNSVTSSASCEVSVERSTFMGNNTALYAYGMSTGTGTIRADHCLIIGNSFAAYAGAGGAVLTRVDLAGNATNTAEANTIGNTFPGSYVSQ